MQNDNEKCNGKMMENGNKSIMVTPHTIIYIATKMEFHINLITTLYICI